MHYLCNHKLPGTYKTGNGIEVMLSIAHCLLFYSGVTYHLASPFSTFFANINIIYTLKIKMATDPYFFKV